MDAFGVESYAIYGTLWISLERTNCNSNCFLFWCWKISFQWKSRISWILLLNFAVNAVNAVNAGRPCNLFLEWEMCHCVYDTRDMRDTRKFATVTSTRGDTNKTPDTVENFNLPCQEWVIPFTALNWFPLHQSLKCELQTWPCHMHDLNFNQWNIRFSYKFLSQVKCRHSSLLNVVSRAGQIV